jgi:hypothetical protein
MTPPAAPARAKHHRFPSESIRHGARSRTARATPVGDLRGSERQPLAAPRRSDYGIRPTSDAET